MGRGQGQQTWKEKIADDTERLSRYPQAKALFAGVDNCSHTNILKRYEMIGNDERMCNDCGLINPPKAKGQKLFWSCDCGQENSARKRLCGRCRTPRGERMSKELQEKVDHREEWIRNREHELYGTTNEAFINGQATREYEASYGSVFS